MGVGYCSNLAVKKAKGKFFIRVDSDDYLGRLATEIMSNILRENKKISFVYCDHIRVDRNGFKEEKVQLDQVLSPSLATILKKISPDASSVIDQFTSQEENVVLPVSVVKNFAVMKYPSSSEQESVQGFVKELSESQSDDTNVPPENMQASQGMMAPEPDMTNVDNTDAIDQDLA